MKDEKEIDEGFGDGRINIRTDLTKNKNAAAYIIKQNLDKINACKTKEEIIALMHQLFDEAKLNTPWTAKFFYLLNGKHDYASALKLVYDAMLKGQGLGVIRENDEELNESLNKNEKEEFQKKLREGKVEFKYKKKDGTERKAVGTMDPALMDLPEKKTQSDVDGAEKKKTRKLPEDSVFYYDLEAKGFRSFKMDNFIGYV